MYESLEVQDYRGFDLLRLDDLGLVNLIVGPNNSGKTALLEVLAWLTMPGAAPMLLDTLRGDKGMRWVARAATGQTVARLRGVLRGGENREVAIGAEPGLRAPVGSGVGALSLADVQAVYRPADGAARAVAISGQARSEGSIAGQFAAAVRAPSSEAAIEDLLRSVDSRVRSLRIDLTGTEPFISVDLGMPERLPLSQAGQGMVRLVSILTALLGPKPEVCLLDEIENGIHYSALQTLWEGLAEIAERLGVQVFATTHSAECLAAAHRAFAERDTYGLRVVQLYLVNGTAGGRTLARDQIEALIEAEIEVR